MCGMREGCYAASGPLAIHWKKVSSGERGMAWGDFLHAIRSLPEGTLWRHNQAGDLVGNGYRLNTDALGALARANTGRRGFTYTHYRPKSNAELDAINSANLHGFTVNLSADSLAEADSLADLRVAPVVVALPADQVRNLKTPAGRTVVVCPAAKPDADTNCAECQLCSRANRETIVGFPLHGSGAKKLRKVVSIKAV